jgi:hypothetical protein
MAREMASELRLVEDGTAGAEDLVEEYLLTLRGRSPSTMEAYGRALHKFLPGVQNPRNGVFGRSGTVRALPRSRSRSARHRRAYRMHRTQPSHLMDKNSRLNFA